MINIINIINIIIIILGIIIGYNLFYIFKKYHIKYVGPNSKDIKSNIYKDIKTNKCYIFEPKVYMCPI